MFNRNLIIPDFLLYFCHIYLLNMSREQVNRLKIVLAEEQKTNTPSKAYQGPKFFSYKGRGVDLCGE